MDKTELNDVIKFAKINGMMNWSFEEVLNEYETTKMHHKESKFDPKSFKPFDKVLGFYEVEGGSWECAIFSHLNETEHSAICTGIIYNKCIPYNEDTKHLVGTNEDCPEYYKWWEEQV